ncbi:hypothetical protein EfmAA610_27710 [Enterococcus faecium]|nr:hypothetical protein EfmAA610_27710 [Enterococcus faecium]
MAQAELTMIPQTTIDLNEEQKEQLERLVDTLLWYNFYIVKKDLNIFRYLLN